MMTLLLCGLLLFSPGDTMPVTTPPPTEAEDVLEAVDLTPWDDLFAHMEDGEAWQRPSALIRSIAAGEEDPALRAGAQDAPVALGCSRLYNYLHTNGLQRR